MTITNIINRIYRLTGTNSTTYPSADLLEDINIAYNRIISVIMSADGRWEYDDTNQTDLPIATTNLVSGQQDYSLPATFLKVTRVECATDSTGNMFQTLNYYDQSDEYASLTYLATLSGIPNRYDQIGASVFLDPKPNYNCTSGLKVWFQRAPVEFTSGDVSTGTKQPGFSQLYHDLIPLWVAYEFWLIYDASKVTKIQNAIMQKEDMLKKDYASRNKTDHRIMKPKKILYK